MKIIGLLAGAAMLLGAQGAYAATVDLVQNGSFESGTNPDSFHTEAAGSGAIADWDIDDGSVNYIGSYWTAADGSRSVDLSGNAPGTISQTIVGLTDGQQYTLSFSIRGNGDGGVDPQKLEATIGGISTTYSAIKGDANWAVQTFTFIYQNGIGNDLLTFAANSLNGFYGPGLDKVSIAATPIPGAILLFGSALGGMGFLGYRRRKAQAAA